MDENETNEYLKRLHERLSKLQDDIDNKNSNDESSNFDESANKNITENNIDYHNEDFEKTQILPKIQDLSEYKDNSIEVEKWREKKYGSSSKTSTDQEDLLAKEREQIEKENQAFLERINARSKDVNLHKEESSFTNDSNVMVKERTFEENLHNSPSYKEELEDGNEEKLQNKKSNRQEPQKPKKRWKKVLKILFIITYILTLLGSLALFLFFKTGLFQYHKELWVETAMTTMNHQYLATWFLSDTEINKIMKDLEVVNDEDSILHAVELPPATTTPKENVIKIDKITGDNYVGHVMTISDPSKVKLVDSRKRDRGTKLSEICKNNNAIAGINAGGFVDPDGNGDGNLLTEPTIINKELLYGDEDELSSWIALTQEGELVLGKYTYQEAMDIGVVSGLQFGPYIIVNGKNQITRSNQGGLHPRMGIGQKRDGTIIFVCIDGRQPGYSIGTTLLELQNIFERYGAYNAANLDGGSSATMYYDGEVVNRTSTPMGERYLPNAFIVEK